MKKSPITIYDATLRDGNHAVQQQISLEQIKAYATAAELAGIDILEVGHGNGLGASSLQVGQMPNSIKAMLDCAKSCLNHTRLAAFMLPGWATTRDLEIALDCGVEVIRVGSHCTESDLTEKHIKLLSKRNIEAQGVLLMSHMASLEQLAEEAKRMEGYGATAVGIFDSSGHYMPGDVSARIKAIRAAVNIPLIFHAHNNLSMAVANSIAAAEAGVTIIDACIRGFGAGAGNTQIEVIVPVLERLGYTTNIDFYKILDAAVLAQKMLIFAPTISTESIVSGLSGVFSGFKTRAIQVAESYGVDVRDVFYELGRRQVIAGQEDLIIEVAKSLMLSNELKKNQIEYDNKSFS